MINFCFSLSATPIYLIHERRLYPPDRSLFAEFIHIGHHSPTILMSSTYTHKNSCDVRWTQRHSKIGTYPQMCFRNYFSNLLSKKQSCPRVAVLVSFKRNNGFYDCVQIFRSSTGWKSYPYVWAFCLCNLINLGDSDKVTCVFPDIPRPWFLLSDHEAWNVCIQTFLLPP